jgi:hypothetical protein
MPEVRVSLMAERRTLLSGTKCTGQRETVIAASTIIRGKRAEEKSRDARPSRYLFLFPRRLEV